MIFNAFSVLVPGVGSFAILVLLRPFGLDTFDTSQVLIIGIIISLVVMFSVWGTVQLLSFLLPDWMAEDNWTVGKEIGLIIIVLFVIATIIFTLVALVSRSESPSFELFFIIGVRTLTIGVFPIILMVLVEQYRHLHTQLRSAKAMTDQISNPTPTSSRQTIALPAENGKVALQLAPETIIYLRSDGNYLEVYYWDEAKSLQMELIRNRMKAIVDLLPADAFFQCHKSFVVNLDHLVAVQGNARNFELNLQYVPDAIPVSRAKSADLQTVLHDRLSQ